MGEGGEAKDWGMGQDERRFILRLLVKGCREDNKEETREWRNAEQRSITVGKEKQKRTRKKVEKREMQPAG